MPYSRETAGKGGHSDFVNNPDVQSFLSDCDYMKLPSDEEAAKIVSSFVKAPLGSDIGLPKFVIASDASKKDTPISDKLPSTQLGFIKVSHILIAMDKYAELIDPASRFVDPFKVAEMHRNARPLTFVLPGCNIKYKGALSVKGGFRRAVFDQLSSNMRDGPSRMVLTEILLNLNGGEVTIKACPECGVVSAQFQFSNEQQSIKCNSCENDIYVTDWLRLHEGISDFGDNSSAITRMMNAVEHLLLAAFILELLTENPTILSTVAFVIDGPLALFGEPAKLHQRLMDLIYRANEKLQALALQPILIMGLQKTGGVMDHAHLLNRFLPNGVLRIIDDAYRHTFITGSDTPSSNFGNETYYGQDFLFKTERGRMFNFALPYPFKDKSGPSFSTLKTKLVLYGPLIERACDLIRHFELDLYESAIVPVALAHRHASISLVPGGKVLDLLTKERFNRAK